MSSVIVRAVADGQFIALHHQRSDNELKEEWLEWNGTDLMVKSSSILKLFASHQNLINQVELFEIFNTTIGISQIYMVSLLNNFKTMMIHVKLCGQMNNNWLKFFEMDTSDQFNEKSKLEIYGLDGPNFILKQDSHLLYINSNNEVLLTDLNEEESSNVKFKIIYCNYTNDRDFVNIVIASNRNQYSLLNVPVCFSRNECSFIDWCDKVSDQFKLPPSSFSTHTSCLTFHKNSTIIGNVEKQVLIFRDNSITKCIELKSIPVKISILTINNHPVKEEYLIVHTSDRRVSIVSLLDYSIQQEIQNVSEYHIGDFMYSGSQQLICFHNELSFGKVSYTLIPNMNECITDGTTTTKEKNMKGKHLYSVIRSLASRIEQCHHDLTKIESNNSFKSQLIQHQQEVTLDILREINSSSTSTMNLDENDGELELGTRIQFKNNTINFGNSLFYDKRIEGRRNKETSDITIQYASQSFNINQWTIRTVFNKNNSNLDLLIVPISNNYNMESEIFKTESSEKSDLVLKMKTPQHYSDPNLSVKCMVIKKDNTNPNQTQFEYLGSIQPSIMDKLFGIKSSPIELEQPDIQHLQFILLRNNKSHTGGSIEKIMRECLSNDLGMNILKTDATTAADTSFEFNSLSKGYNSSLYYRIQYYQEQVAENESSLICELFADTNETIMLVIEKIQQILKSENIILLLSPLVMMKDRRELISSLSKEVKHIIFKLHDHVKKMTLMNPQEREIQNDILVYLQLQMETDKIISKLLE